MTAGAQELVAEREQLRDRPPLAPDQAIIERDGHSTVVRVLLSRRYFVVVDHCGVRVRFERTCGWRKANGYVLTNVGGRPPGTVNGAEVAR